MGGGAGGGVGVFGFEIRTNKYTVYSQMQESLSVLFKEKLLHVARKKSKNLAPVFPNKRFNQPPVIINNKPIESVIKTVNCVHCKMIIHFNLTMRPFMNSPHRV